MSDIAKLKCDEILAIYDFLDNIRDYGHIYYDDPQLLDEPFNKILEGMESILTLIQDNYSR